MHGCECILPLVSRCDLGFCLVADLVVFDGSLKNCGTRKWKLEATTSSYVSESSTSSIAQQIMLSLPRMLRARVAYRTAAALSHTYSTKPSGGQLVDDVPGSTSSNKITSHNKPDSDINSPDQVPNVSKTNEIPMSMQGMKDGKIYELAEQAEERRTMQAPNRAGVWSRSQQPREVAMSGPRFEQTIMEMQVSFA